ncbi:MAG: DUF309 domain-containing protein [Planctomycetales bacterium]
MIDDYPEQYLHAVQLFNEEDFFECHDVLEELWSETIGPEKKFYQGLIQVAICLFHFGNENLGGARKLYESCYKYLEPYQPTYMSIDVSRLLQDLQRCLHELLSAPPGEYPTGVHMQDELVPKIAFLPDDN